MNQQPSDSDPFIELVLAMENNFLEAQSPASGTETSVRIALFKQMEDALAIAKKHPEKYEALKTRMRSFNYYRNGGFKN